MITTRTRLPDRRDEGRPRPSLLRRHAVLALCALLPLTAACGSSGTPDAADASADGADADADVASLGTDDTGDSTAPDGTGPTDGGSTDPVDFEEAMLEYAQCMREHGVDYPDPEFSGDGGPIRISAGVDASDPDMVEADEACHGIMDAATSNFEPMDPAAQAEMQEQMLAFAECMREHGIDFPDPQMSDDGSITISVGGGPGGAPGADNGAGMPVDPMSDPDFAAAQEACQGELPVPPGAAEVGG